MEVKDAFGSPAPSVSRQRSTQLYLTVPAEPVRPNLTLTIETFEVHRISSIDETASTFGAQVYVRAVFRDGVNILDGELANKLDEPYFPTRDDGPMWKPNARWYLDRLVFDNMCTPPKEQLKQRDQEARVEKSDIVLTIYTEGLFYECFELWDFPFDAQDLTFTLSLNATVDGPVGCKLERAVHVDSVISVQGMLLKHRWFNRPYSNEQMMASQANETCSIVENSAASGLKWEKCGPGTLKAKDDLKNVLKKKMFDELEGALKEQLDVFAEGQQYIELDRRRFEQIVRPDEAGGEAGGDVIWDETAFGVRVTDVHDLTGLNGLLTRAGDKVVVVYAYTKSSLSCKTAAPGYAKLSESFSDASAVFAKVDVNSAVDVATKLKASAMLTLLVFKGEKEVAMEQGWPGEAKITEILMLHGAGAKIEIEPSPEWYESAASSLKVSVLQLARHYITTPFNSVVARIGRKDNDDQLARLLSCHYIEVQDTNGMGVYLKPFTKKRIFPCVFFNVKLCRCCSYHVINIIMPLTLIVLIGFLQFTMEPEESTRIEVSLGLVMVCILVCPNGSRAPAFCPLLLSQRAPFDSLVHSSNSRSCRPTTRPP